MPEVMKDIKIPYPTEGIVRTAQLDDTVAPDDSVQLAVNMNFDRVGAVQTRPGVTEYADTLSEEITNFGKLSNSYIPGGYETIEQLGAIDSFSTPVRDTKVVKINDTKVTVFWTGTDNDGFCQNFEVDPASGVMTPLGTPLEFDTASASGIQAVNLSGIHVLAAWSGTGNDGFVQAFDVSGDTIIAESTAFEFNATRGTNITLSKITSSKVICFYSGPGDNGIAHVFSFSGGAVSIVGTPFTFDASGFNYENSCASLGDGQRFLNSYNGSNGSVRMFEVNLTTWNVTALGTAITFDVFGAFATWMPIGDGQHFVAVYQGGTPTFGNWAKTYSVNLSTYNITQVGTGVRFRAGGGNDLAATAMGDGEHFVAFYSVNIGDGYVQMLRMNPSTYDITMVGDTLEGYSFANRGYTSAVTMTPFKVAVFWGRTSATEIGDSAMFVTLGALTGGRWLYGSHGTDVSNWDGSAWTVRRSSLAEVSKPRFSQYLSYIWMVNGNKQIGGDPVATSRGGAFGTEMVPEDFPKGDFIHAGFEGRVWVFNKTLGRIDYTDIVQFAPPNAYSLTYDKDENFITTIAPQTGQTFTAVQKVPRALLVFTQDSIYRIYGATSLDAYPAYSVGTYSQESIVETKTGIFFHHSSGFYQFDYGSQPLEISRKVIDFVKAIPRSAYDNIVGVYDGFNNVEWSIGSVTVEDVTFTNCVMRYTISTQVWTVYDYVGNNITAMISYDDGTTLNHLMGTSTGLVGALDTGTTDFGASIYFEMIDRWRSFTPMYYKIKALSGINVYSENAAGTNITYQIQKSGPNVWKPLGTIDERNNSYLPNEDSDDFDVLRLRLAGNTNGTPIVIHGIEIPEIVIKGTNEN